MATTNSEKNIATFLHLSALTQYFIPFGSFIFPIVIWGSKKNESEYIDLNGKNVLNFQLSILLYMMVLAIIAIPIFIYTIFKSMPFEAYFNDHEWVFDNFALSNLGGIAIVGITAAVLFFSLKAIEFILIIYGAVKASNGEGYKYPLSIPFIK